MAAAGHSGLLKSSFGVAVATLISRVLGLGRVMLEARVLGGGAVAGAWLFAFSVPNLFRRLLGEGALGTSLIPLLAHIERQDGRAAQRQSLAIVFCALAALLALIVIVVSFGVMGFRALADRYWLELFPSLGTPRVQWVLYLIPLLMPYAFFICLIGVIGAVLNTHRIFFLPALGALILNVLLIAALGLGYLRGVSGEEVLRLLPLLVWMVLLSGLIQLLLMLFLLWKIGAFPLFQRASWGRTHVLRDLWRMVLPGVIGGSALQVSFVVDRMLALSLGEQALPALGYVDRLIDLPIGIFAVSLGSVLMVDLSHRAAAEDHKGMVEGLTYALRHVYFIGVPMAIGIIVFREPLLRLLLRGGNYSEADLAAALPVALCYGIGIPSFCSLKMILPMFHARKIMGLPMKVSLLCIAVNLILCLVLMRYIAQSGIALATVAASMLNNGILLWILRKEGLAPPGRILAFSFGRTVAAGCVAALPAVFVSEMLQGFFMGKVLAPLLALAVFGLIYLAAAALLGCPEIKECVALVRRRRRKNAGNV